MPAAGANGKRGLAAPVNHQITAVGNPGEGVGKNENRIPFMNRITQQGQCANEAEPPEGLRHHDLFSLFRGIPLNQKAREENRVAEPADGFPHAPFDAEQFAIVPDEVEK